MKVKIITLLIVLVCGGCNLPYKPQNRQDKLNQLIDNNLANMISINNQIGAITRCSNIILSSLHRSSVPPSNRIDWMVWNVKNIKLGR